MSDEASSIMAAIVITFFISLVVLMVQNYIIIPELL